MAAGQQTTAPPASKVLTSNRQPDIFTSLILRLFIRYEVFLIIQSAKLLPISLASRFEAEFEAVLGVFHETDLEPAHEVFETIQFLSYSHRFCCSSKGFWHRKSWRKGRYILI